MRKITAALADLCAAELRALGVQAPRRRLAAIKAYLDLRRRTGSPPPGTAEDADPWNLLRFVLNNLSLQEITKKTGISVTTLRAIRDGANPAATPPPALIAACAGACRSRLRRAGIETPRSRPEVLELYRDVREQDLARLSSADAELKLLESEQQADPHARFRYWHDLTGCWKSRTVHTRYLRASVDTPRGHRSSWAKVRSVESILSEAYAELGEDFNTFTRRVCDAVHERPRRIADLRRGVRDLRDHLDDGQLLPL